MTDASPFKPPFRVEPGEAPEPDTILDADNRPVALQLICDRLNATPSAQSQGAGDWVLAPREPTEDMLRAMHDGPLAADDYSMGDNQREWLREMYAAALAAAPSAPQPEASGTVPPDWSDGFACGVETAATRCDGQLHLMDSEMQGYAKHFAEQIRQITLTPGRASARPGLTSEERDIFDQATWLESRSVSGMCIKELRAVIARLTQEPK